MLFMLIASFVSAKEGAKASQSFSEADIVGLFQQMVKERSHVPEGSPHEWSRVIMSATEGVKGLSGAILAEVRHICVSIVRALGKHRLGW